MSDVRFMSAYRAGINSGQTFGGEPNVDLHIEWRVAVSCWAASNAMKLPGDFVECGVCTGITSLAICNYVDFNSSEKNYWLFDTFSGIPVDMASVDDGDVRRMNAINYPNDVYEIAKQNFAPFPRATLVRGRVPDTLPTVPIKTVCFLHIDMNLVKPERAALEYFWPKITPGGFIILDDYGWLGHSAQMRSADEFARSQGVEILALPTGQGLMLKPALAVEDHKVDLL